MAKIALDGANNTRHVCDIVAKPISCVVCSNSGLDEAIPIFVEAPFARDEICWGSL